MMTNKQTLLVTSVLALQEYLDELERVELRHGLPQS